MVQRDEGGSTTQAGRLPRPRGPKRPIKRRSGAGSSALRTPSPGRVTANSGAPFMSQGKFGAPAQGI